MPESIGAIRLVSAGMGALTCFLLYQLAKDVSGSPSFGLVAGALLAFDPISIGESSYGLLDPGVTMFYMVSILFFYRFARNGKALDFFASAVTFGLAVGSKYYAVIAFPILVGILLWKRKFGMEWRSMAVFLWVSVIIFLAVQPVLWASPLVNLSRSLAVDRVHIAEGHLIKAPGNPFLIPQTRFRGGPLIYIGSNPLASKPGFYANTSDGVQSPWWYLLYIQAMYSTPFELLVYPLAIGCMVVNAFRRKLTDLMAVSALLVSVPTIFFAVLHLRLPQYAILPGAAAAMFGPVAFAGLAARWRRVFILSLLVFHVGWTFYALLTAGNHFTGWGFDETFLTPILANFFGLLWKLTRGVH